MVNLLKNFITGKDTKVIDKVPPTIFRSWNRCRRLSINHERLLQGDVLLQTNLKELLAQNEDLLIAAKPVMQQIFNFLRCRNYVLVLSNNQGYILETLGSSSLVAKTKKIFLAPGVNWQEDLKGTNGIGTVLVEKIPLAIPAWTHYSLPVNFLDCWASPIRRANGDLIGVLNISGEAGNRHEHLMEITTIGTNMIEQQLQISEISEQFNLCRENLDIIGNKLSNDVSGLRQTFRVPGLTLGTKKDCALGKSWQGRSPKTRAVFDISLRAAKADSTVLIQGESGTGKEIVARNIHQSGLRKSKPFVTLNCAAIPDSLVESELFGYAEGAFTGARKGGQPGKFEQADGGTIFLDEIGDMPINVQASLLRVLQQKELYRIGDGKCRAVDVRIIAATNRDLRQLVDQGKFRLDLYYRLKVILISIPPLRERIEDIWDLAPYFVEKICTKLGLPVLEISPELYQCFAAYSWPGNVRQLENCIESLVALSNGAAILTPDDLADEYKNNGIDLNTSAVNKLVLHANNLERATIIQAIQDSQGNLAAAARLLGIGRTTLYRKLDKLLIPH